MDIYLPDEIWEIILSYIPGSKHASTCSLFYQIYTSISKERAIYMVKKHSYISNINRRDIEFVLRWYNVDMEVGDMRSIVKKIPKITLVDIILNNHLVDTKGMIDIGISTKSLPLLQYMCVHSSNIHNIIPEILSACIDKNNPQIAIQLYTWYLDSIPILKHNKKKHWCTIV